MGSLKSPCGTSYRSSIVTITLNCLLFEKKSRFLLVTDRQTYEHMNRTNMRLNKAITRSSFSYRREAARCFMLLSTSLKAALSRKINMVTFANLGSIRLPSLKFVGLRVRKIRRIQCVSCLSTTVSQLFECIIAKTRHFYVPRPSSFVCPGDAPAAITQNVA